ncbi:hypothetical protein PAXRUDRAFT_828729 [Paxillus rubicundulus Ve08.2h10]|uniref:Uncharacterized protein n=1 Tax=Paxillus rubicundulus Ve08.2h10 TaxID=930991 RepID=A0A0D0E0X5_9AGAM|nr:hypothetical protein PAXRUDRAFT_828729 [Paxillus rubicundulus Ve08.2h10]
MNNLPSAISDEDDQELDQLISKSIHNSPSRLQWDPNMEFTFINEFGYHKRKDVPKPNVLEECAPAKQAKLS